MGLKCPWKLHVALSIWIAMATVVGGAAETSEALIAVIWSEAAVTNRPGEKCTVLSMVD